MADLVTLAYIRAQGLTEAQASDLQVSAGISLASEYFQDEVGMDFSPSVYTADDPLRVDGSGHDTLFLEQPVISLTEMGEYKRGVSGDTKVAFPSYRYEVYNRRGRRGDDDRSNPKIVMVRAGTGSLTYFGGQSLVSSVFPKGSKNVYLVGSFGWTVSVGDEEVAPLDVQRAVATLVICDDAWQLANDTRPSSIDEPLRRFILSETTEGHHYQLSKTAASGGPSGIRSVDRIIARYQALRPHYVGA